MSRRLFLKAGGAAVAAGAVLGAQPVSAAPGRRALTERFAAPTAEVRPSVEWFVPLAPTSDAGIAHDIKAMADAGIGSAQLLGWPVPGSDLAVHGWGTAAWNDRVQAALAAADRHGLTIDPTAGPELPAAVPSITPDGSGASQELVYGHTTVAGGATFDGPVPPPDEFDISDPHGRPDREPGTPTLVAVTAARVAGNRPPGAKPVLLDPASLVDLTGSVRAGRITWTPPAGGEWLLFSFWRRGTGQLVDGTATPSVAIDHYSAAGADALTSYWEEHLLTPPVGRLLHSAGGSFHEEPAELMFVLPWTGNLLERFRELRGYPLTPYLPVLFIERLHIYLFDPAGPRTPADPPDFELADHSGSRIRNDFYQVLTDLYREGHQAVIGRWAHAHGLRYSAKLGPLGVRDSPSLARDHVDEPELDQVFFFDNETDVYRAMAGTVHMGRRPVFTSELSPVTDLPFQDAYGVTWQRMLDIINQNYAAGVSQVKLHHYSYADAPGATWPGWSAWAPLGEAPGLAEAWGPRQPTWRHLPDITGYLARQQLVLRTGQPRVDVAIYRHSYWERSGAPIAFWPDPTLRRAGFGYDFIGPALLDLPTARVAGGRLDPDGPAYRALVLDRQPTMPLPTARKILGCARAGLPVVVVGDPPGRTPFFADAAEQDEALRAVLTRLLAQTTVRRVAAETDVPAALAALGVAPDAAYAAPVDLLTVHRADRATDYYWLFNSGTGPVDVDVSLEGRGHPHALDAWTGGITPIAKYTKDNGRAVTRVRLAPKQTTIIATLEDGPPAVVDSTVDVRHLDGTLVARATTAGTHPVTLAGGRTVRVVVPAVPAPIRLTSWHLSAEDWRPGATATETETVHHELDLPALEPWPRIPGLEHASGIGTYTTTVSLPTVAGAYLDLGEVVGTYRITVNGRRLPPVDQVHPVVDLRGHLRPGHNTIQVEIATTLRNRLRVIEPSQSGTAPQDYGLLGPVTLTPYTEVPVVP